MQNFTKERWSHSLAEKRWEDIGSTENFNEMGNLFSKNVDSALSPFSNYHNKMCLNCKEGDKKFCKTLPI